MDKINKIIDDVEDASSPNETFIKKDQECDVKWFMRKQYYVLLLMFWGKLIACILRLNLSVAIVEMASDRDIVIGTRIYFRKAEFDWNSIEKGIIISSFSWGYFFSQVGGILAEKFGGTKVFGLGLVVSGILSMLTPFLVRINITLFIISRICEGFAESIAMASICNIFISWVPEHEQCLLKMISVSGGYFAPSIAYPLCNYIAKYYGWEEIFIVTGVFSLLWFFVWWTSVSRNPLVDRFISTAEKNYLIHTIDIANSQKVSLECTFRKIFTSKSVWASVNERFIDAWSFSFVFYCLPLYVRDVENKHIDKMPLFANIPHTCSFFGLILSSFLADHIRNKHLSNTTKNHTLFTIGAQIVCIIILVPLTMFMDFIGIITALCVFRCVYGLAADRYCGLPTESNQEYSSVLHGLSITCLSLGYTVNPIIMGLMVPNHTITEWSRYFIFLCIFNVWGTVIFCIFGSSSMGNKDFDQIMALPKGTITEWSRYFIFLCIFNISGIAVFCIFGSGNIERDIKEEKKNEHRNRDRQKHNELLF